METTMPGFLTPESDATMFADLDRRLRTLETTQRVGLNRIRTAWNTSAASVATFDDWYTGPAGAAWADDQGNVGTGYPQLTVVTGTKVLAIVQAFANGIANDPTFRTFGWSLGVGVDGASPPNSRTDRFQTHGPTDEGNNYVTMVHPLLGLEPGEHTFYLSTYWNTANPGAPNVPSIDATNTALLAILPLD